MSLGNNSGGGRPRDDNCYFCGKPGHQKRNCAQQKIENFLNNPDPPSVVEARRFFKQMTNWKQGDGSSIIFLLWTDGNRNKFFDTLRFALSEKMVGSHVLPLLHRLGQDDAMQGMRTQAIELMGNLFSKIPFFVDALALELEKTARKPAAQDEATPLQEDFFLCSPLVQTTAYGRLNAQEVIKTVCWALTNMVIGNREARQSARIKQLAESLCKEKALSNVVAAPLACLRALIHGDRVLASIALAEGGISVDEMAGDRHDNDVLNFKDIQTQPTTAELLCNQEPYLPKPLSEATQTILREHIPAEVRAAASDSSQQSQYLEAYLALLKLDRQYRLLREDYIGPMREILQETRHPSKLPTYQASLVAVQASGLVFETPLPKRHRAFKAATNTNNIKYAEEWKILGSRTLPKDSTIALFEGQKLLRIGTVSEYTQLLRLPTESGDIHPVIRVCVDFVFSLEARASATKGNSSLSSDQTLALQHPDSFTSDQLKALHVQLSPSEASVEGRLEGQVAVSDLLRSLNSDSEFTLVQIGSGGFAVTPVLDRLRRIERIPLAAELLMNQPSQGRPAYLQGLDVEKEICEIQKKHSFEFDAEQLEAVRLALTNRVSLTQGPPGTGKTFIGAKIAEILLSNNQKTPKKTPDSGHDAFLKRLKATIEENGLMTDLFKKTFSKTQPDAAPRPTCRLLVVCETNHALDDFLLDLTSLGFGKGIVRIGGRSKVPELASCNIFNSQASFTQTQRKTHYQLQKSIRECDQKLLEIQWRLKQPCSWEDIKNHLLQTNHDALHFLETMTADEEGFNMVGPGGHKLRQDFLFEKWFNGHPLTATLKSHLNSKQAGACKTNPWDLDGPARKSLYRLWTDEIHRDRRRQCVNLLYKYKELREMSDANRSKSRRKALEAVRFNHC